jgi:hypothetical protein
MNLEINCRNVASGICLKLVTSVSHIPLSKCAENNSGATRTLEAVMNFVKKLHFFQVLHYTVLYINVTEQWPLYIKINFALIKGQSREDV